MTLKEYLFNRRVRKGKAVLGRQATGQHVESRVRGTLSARVIRADGTVEDLGNIADLREEAR